MGMTELSRELRERRLELAMSQRELATTSGVSLTTISAIERGTRSTFGTTTLRSLDRALQWPLDRCEELLTGTQRPKPPLLVPEHDDLRHLLQALLEQAQALSRADLMELLVMAWQMQQRNGDPSNGDDRPQMPPNATLNGERARTSV